MSDAELHQHQISTAWHMPRFLISIVLEIQWQHYFSNLALEFFIVLYIAICIKVQILINDISILIA